ncbi:MAG: TonB-dependent siderophore receptor, partial [Pseudomonadota bacterium]
LPVRGLFVNASVEYKSDQEVELPNDRTLDSFTRFDLGGRYEFEINGKPARVTANVQNVTDDNYWASYGFGLSVAEPRTFNIGIDVGF